MKTSSMKIRIGAAAILWSFLLIVGSSLSPAVQAQYRDNGDVQDRGDDRYDSNRNRRDRNWDNYGNYGGSSQLRQTALNAGYNEGMRDSAADNNRNNADYRNRNTYRKATKGYNSRLGDRELYRRYFREAYEAGYNGRFNQQDTSYGNNRNRDWNRNDDNRDRNSDNNDQNRLGRNQDGYGNFGGSFQLRQTALNAGFNEGAKQGRNDRNKGNGRDYQNQSTYQKATTDYSSRLGDRGIYQRYFREAYEHGYADGYAGY